MSDRCLQLIEGGRPAGAPQQRRTCDAVVGYTWEGNVQRPVGCHGRGYAEVAYQDINGHWRRRVAVCSGCGGTGVVGT